ADCEAGDPHHYQVALTLSPMESDQTIGRSYLPVADGKLHLLTAGEDADSLDSGKGCSSDNGSRTARSVKEPIGIDRKGAQQSMSTFRYDLQHRGSGSPYQSLRCSSAVGKRSNAAHNTVHFKQWSAGEVGMDGRVAPAHNGSCTLPRHLQGGQQSLLQRQRAAAGHNGDGGGSPGGNARYLGATADSKSSSFV
ncbi:hypothetical protein BOX15_Mlig012171g1, partial [Macrostomum lignano]